MTALPDFDVAGQVVAVSGAGRGIGRAIALDMAASGARVAACSRTTGELESLVREIEAAGGECAIVTTDLSTVAGVDAFIDHTVEAYGRIDALINNAGFNVLHDALDYTEEEVDTLININYKSAYFACMAAARHMIRQGDGGIDRQHHLSGRRCRRPGQSPVQRGKGRSQQPEPYAGRRVGHPRHPGECRWLRRSR